MNHEHDHDGQPELDIAADPALARNVQPLIGKRLVDIERELICGTLARCGGNRTWAADILGIDLASLRDRIVAIRAVSAPCAEDEPDDTHLATLRRFSPGRRLPS